MNMALTGNPEAAASGISIRFHTPGRGVKTPMAPLKLVSKEQDGTCIYEIEAPTKIVGHCGYTIRVVPQYMDKVEYIPGIIKWF